MIGLSCWLVTCEIFSGEEFICSGASRCTVIGLLRFYVE